jgi:hypothetical protein
MDTIVETIKKMIEDETEKKFTKFIEHISRTYDISLKMLLRDLHSFETAEVPAAAVVVTEYCNGLKKDGTRCKHSGKFNGYCKWHKSQFRPKRDKPTVPPKPPVDVSQLCDQFSGKLLIEF